MNCITHKNKQTNQNNQTNKPKSKATTTRTTKTTISKSKTLLNSPWAGASSRAGAIFGVNNRSIGERRWRVAVTEVAAGGEGAADGVVVQ